MRGSKHPRRWCWSRGSRTAATRRPRPTTASSRKKRDRSAVSPQPRRLRRSLPVLTKSTKRAGSQQQAEETCWTLPRSSLKPSKSRTTTACCSEDQTLPSSTFRSRRSRGKSLWSTRPCRLTTHRRSSSARSPRRIRGSRCWTRSSFRRLPARATEEQRSTKTSRRRTRSMTKKKASSRRYGETNSSKQKQTRRART